MGQGGGQGGGRWGAPESSVGAKSVPNNSSDLAGDEGGRRGRGWAREAGKGGEIMGGGPESNVPPFGLP